MFAIGAALTLAHFILFHTIPSFLKMRWTSYLLSLGVGLMGGSLLVLAWRWLP